MTDWGLPPLRVAFVARGTPKLRGGPAAWATLHTAMADLGVTFAPAVWGLAAATSEAVGGALLALGLLFRPARVVLFATLAVAVVMYLPKGDPFHLDSHAVEEGVVFLALLVAGPGGLSLDRPRR